MKGRLLLIRYLLMLTGNNNGVEKGKSVELDLRREERVVFWVPENSFGQGRPMSKIQRGFGGVDGLVEFGKSTIAWQTLSMLTTYDWWHGIAKELGTCS